MGHMRQVSRPMGEQMLVKEDEGRQFPTLARPGSETAGCTATDRKNPKLTRSSSEISDEWCRECLRASQSLVEESVAEVKWIMVGRGNAHLQTRRAAT